MMTKHRLPTLLLMALAITACQPADQATPADTAATAAAASAAATKDAQASKTPALKVELLDGSTWDIADRRGKWVVVNYWATWCAPCLKEMPDFDAFDQARVDVDVIGLAFEEIEVSAMQAFLKERPVSYPISIIDVFNPPLDFETPRGLPMTYLIAPGGSIAKQFLGPITSKDLEKAIAEHGQGKGM